ncbi:hypothetical protein CNMCM8694_008051 [Aspergillus lentulus]|nr:hypothetical protein CNMCM8060_007377 [Aspergillus lentulus]KAF4194006.1 hypothetical protein CNMCM8694_008051 [Aspergillus lentulus]
MAGMEINNELGDQADKITQERLRCYRGSAKVELRFLAFEQHGSLGARPLDQSNVDRLITIFNIKGCQHLEPEHRVAAVISQDVLTRSLELSGVSQSALLNHVDPPHLVFQDDVRLICPYGQHRLKAAEAYGEAWWLVELYLDDIPPDALVQLREESAKSKDLKDGDVFRTYQLYKLLGNYAQERKWWARFGSDERRKTIRRLQQHQSLITGIDKLLPYTGLWEPVKASHLRKILNLRCHESVHLYLTEIHKQWSSFFATDKETISKRMFRAICTENFYVANDRKIRSVARQFNEVTREIIFAFFSKEPLYGIICQAQDQSSTTDIQSSLGLGVSSESRGEAANNNNTSNVEEDPESTHLTGHQNNCASTVEVPPEEDNIKLLPHPPGTPDRDRMHGIENDIPLASGFKEHICKAPLNQKAEITLYQKAVEILQTWYQAEVQNLIILFLFETQSYFKFAATRGFKLHSTLRDLSREHYFLVYNPDSTTVITHVKGNVAYNKALQHQLIFIGKQDCPLHKFEDRRGQISVDYLEKYLSHYDIKTGKRKNSLQSARQRKRRAVEASQ